MLVSQAGSFAKPNVQKLSASTFLLVQTLTVTALRLTRSTQRAFKFTHEKKFEGECAFASVKGRAAA